MVGFFALSCTCQVQVPLHSAMADVLRHENILDVDTYINLLLASEEPQWHLESAWGARTDLSWVHSKGVIQQLSSYLEEERFFKGSAS